MADETKLSRSEYQRLQELENDPEFRQKERQRVEKEYLEEHPTRSSLTDEPEKKSKKNKLNRFLNWTIGLLIIAIVIVFLLLFLLP